MEFRTIYTISFSPTGSTEKIVSLVGSELSAALSLPVEKIGFTRPAERENEHLFSAEDLVILGFPTYAGKLPNKILPDLKRVLHASGTPAIALVSFGNRSYDNSLAELCAVLKENGFSPIAAGAFVTQHAFTDELGYARPGWSDQFEIKRFAAQVADKLRKATTPLPEITVPGDSAAPYYVPKGIDGQPAQFLKAKPKIHLSRCSNCGACARLCPMGAIDPKNPANVPGTCIKCHACVRKCTKGAKYFDDPAFLSHVAMLEQNFTDPKDNETFL